MCRYGLATYKSKFVCFGCRKSFKKVALEDYIDQRPLTRQKLDRLWPYGRGLAPSEHSAALDSYRSEQALVLEAYRRDVGICPQCGGEMRDLGHDFRAPKQRDIAAWKAAEAAHRLGHRFHSCGCDGPGFIPSTKAEYRRYLAERLALFEQNYHAAMASGGGNSRADEATYWAERVTLVKSELQAG